ncbi:unnamed protein product [Caretta caretta]
MVRNEDAVVIKARDDKSMDQASGSRNREGTDFKDIREEAPDGLIGRLYVGEKETEYDMKVASLDEGEDELKYGWTSKKRCQIDSHKAKTDHGRQIRCGERDLGLIIIQDMRMDRELPRERV